MRTCGVETTNDRYYCCCSGGGDFVRVPSNGCDDDSVAMVASVSDDAARACSDCAMIDAVIVAIALAAVEWPTGSPSSLVA